MRFFKRTTQPEVFVRLGLGLTFLYSGYDIYKNPENWMWYLERLPSWMLDPITAYITLEKFLFINGVSEVVFGMIFILWFTPRWAVKLVSLFVALKLAIILWLIGIDTVTFRDIGLLGATLAVFASTYRRH